MPKRKVTTVRDLPAAVLLSRAVTFPCPRCGKGCEAGWLDGELPAVTHEVPTCCVFEKLGPVEFLHYAQGTVDA